MRTNRVLGALAVALLSSCADYGAPDEVLYGEAVYTQPAPGVNFAGFGTYYLDPEYTEVNGDSLRPVALPPSVETSIESNMAALGYTRIDTGDQAADLGAADVGLKVSVLSGRAATRSAASSSRWATSRVTRRRPANASRSSGWARSTAW
jgi:hypothetical protein